MMKKIITGLAIAAASLMVSIGTPSFNSLIGETAVIAEAAGKVLSMEDAAKKLVKTAYKAHDQKKKLTTSVTIKCPSKKAADNYMDKLSKAIVKEELGEFSDVEDIAAMSEVRNLTSNKDGSYTRGDTYKNGKLTVKVTYDGKDKEWRKYNERIIYEKQNMGELRELTKGMSEIDKAWRIAVWLMVDHKTKYYGDPSKFATSDKDIAKNRAQGNCSSLNMMYTLYATRMGIKAGGVSSNDHDSNWVVIDGKLYYLDMQGVGVAHDAWQIMHDEDYNDENVDAGLTRNKYVPDPTGRWLKVPSDWAEAMENGLITVYPWEVSEGEWCWLTEKQAKIKLPEEGFGKPSKWKYWWY
ncbi:MAG: hypothetical protein HFH67_17205 [Lachnospiraceae bacterium]|nr:hypothetical protein [Lachnospiraceae bacterium]